MSTRTVERVVEELAGARVVAVVELYGSRNVVQFDRGTRAGGVVGSGGCAVVNVRGIERQREAHGDVAVELAMALAEEFWCDTCRASVGKGWQLRNHRQMGHVVTL